MSRMIWGELPPEIETGLDRGVLYFTWKPGIPWNGLVSASEENPSADNEVLYYDGVPYNIYSRTPDSQFIIDALYYPEEFEPYDGFGNESPKPWATTFGLSYRTQNGSNFKIHLVYNAIAKPAKRMWESNAEQAKISLFSWELSAKPAFHDGFAPSAHLIVDTSIATPESIEALENVIYGTESSPAILPGIDVVASLIESEAILIIVDHGDGTWTVIGPDEAIEMLDPTTFQITWPSAVMIDEDTYTISSL